MRDSKTVKTKKTKKTPPQQEWEIQRDCVEWYKHTFPNQLIFSVPLEAARRGWQRYEAMGAMHGTPDLVLTLGKGHILFVEMKTKRGVQSEHQKEFEAAANALGFSYYLCRSLGDFKNAILSEWNLIKAAEKVSNPPAEPDSGAVGTTTPQTGENVK